MNSIHTHIRQNRDIVLLSVLAVCCRKLFFVVFFFLDGIHLCADYD